MNFHRGRPNASELALELISDPNAEKLYRPAFVVLARIADREMPYATALEWGFLSLAEAVLEHRRAAE